MGVWLTGWLDSCWLGGCLVDWLVGQLVEWMFG